ncbi:hypothetical protein RIF29_23791 [Crotalaria pallida]|uniref:Uncharacterized protein n=1 Tax=Crotalaria pallida TaxID=3830 RepID=A0AAN9F823_CROPI
MAALYVTATATSCYCSSSRFSFSLLFHVPELRPFAFNSRKRTTSLRCALSQDAKKALKDHDTVEIDSNNNNSIIHGLLLKETDQKGPMVDDDKSSETWSQFAKRVSGEWDGFGADFSNEGKPIELPESVVPEAYREWEVKVFDWQTQCPTLAQPEDRILEYKTIQLLPTVGCEADAATRYSIGERKIGGDDSGVTAFAYQSSGSYVAVWQKNDNLLELEYCLISPQDFESRVRIIQQINVIDNTKLVLQSIKVFREQWYGPFRNGEQLGGCAIRDSAFASTAPLIASEVSGVWHGSKAVAAFGTENSEIFQQLIDDKMQNTVRDGDDNILLLPKKLWTSLNQGKDGETLSEVGWLLDHGQAITASCLFSTSAKLKEISIALVTKAVEDV